MCTNTNRALVNSLECYMDDLVDCFEDFVKKSIIVISIAVGILVGVIAYVMKTIADRTQPPCLSGDSAALSRLQRDQIESDCSNTCLNSKKAKSKRKDPKKTSKKCPATDVPCYEEKLLKNIGYSGCSKTDCEALNAKKSVSKTRPSIPSLPTNEQSGSNSNIKGNQESCCSMCCDDKCDG